MGSFGTFGYSLVQGIKNIQRNKLFSIASIATMSACIFLFGVLYFILANVEHSIVEAESSVGITVFFNEGIEEERIMEIGKTISAVPGVTECKYLGPEETWDKYKSEYFTDELAATFGEDNPLKDSMSFTVYFDDVSYQNKATGEIAKIDGVRKVNDTKEIVATLTKVNTALRVGTIIIVALLLSIAAFLISTTVTMGVTVRKREISIMHLIGATDSFIKGPFIIEGVLIGLLGVCVPLSLLYALYYKVIALIASKFSNVLVSVNFVSIDDVFMVVAPVSLIIGIGVGLFASSATLNKQLKAIRSL